jgi:hypothetical protein
MAIIQELENKTKKLHFWTEDEIDTLKRYYGKFPVKELLPHFPSRNTNTITQMAIKLKLTPKKIGRCHQSTMPTVATQRAINAEKGC